MSKFTKTFIDGMEAPADIIETQFKMLIETGRNPYTLDCQKDVYESLLAPKLEREKVTFATSLNTGGTISVTYSPRDKDVVNSIRNECLLEAGVYGQVSPEMLKSIYSDSQLNTLSGLTELEKEALKKQLQTEQNVTMAFTALKDGTYKAIWINSKNKEALNIIRGTVAKLGGEHAKEYKETIDRDLREKAGIYTQISGREYLGRVEGEDGKEIEVEYNSAKLRDRFVERTVSKDDPNYEKKLKEFLYSTKEPVIASRGMTPDKILEERKKRYPQISKELDEWLKHMDEINKYYQSYLTYSDTERVAGKLSMNLIEQATLFKCKEEIANKINNTIDKDELQKFVDTVREYTQDMTVDEPSEAYNAMEARYEREVVREREIGDKDLGKEDREDKEEPDELER